MKHTNDQDHQLFAQLNPWSTAAGPLLETSVKVTDAMCTRAFKVAAEITDFTLLRVQEDIRLPERISRCRSPQEVQQAWIDFWSKAFAQYQNEWSRLAEINRAGIAEFSQQVEKAQRQTRIAA